MHFFPLLKGDMSFPKEGPGTLSSEIRYLNLDQIAPQWQYCFNRQWRNKLREWERISSLCCNGGICHMRGHLHIKHFAHYAEPAINLVDIDLVSLKVKQEDSIILCCHVCQSERKQFNPIRSLNSYFICAEWHSTTCTFRMHSQQHGKTDSTEIRAGARLGGGWGLGKSLCQASYGAFQ